MGLIICTDGQMTCLYTEDIDLSALGQCHIRRASHVEPDGNGQWWADLSPVAGPMLGPYERRGEALAAEAAWLESRLPDLTRP